MYQKHLASPSLRKTLFLTTDLAPGPALGVSYSGPVARRREDLGQRLACLNARVPAVFVPALFLRHRDDTFNFGRRDDHDTVRACDHLLAEVEDEVRPCRYY